MSEITETQFEPMPHMFEGEKELATKVQQWYDKCLWARGEESPQ